MQRDLSLRRDTRGENIRMVVNGQKFTERSRACEALVYLVGGDTRGMSPAIVGELAGFKVEFRPTAADTITLRGEMTYTAKISPSLLGIIASLEHAARSIEERLEMRRADLEQTKKNLAELSALLGEPFEP